MSAQLPVVLYNGIPKSLQSGDTIAGANVDPFTTLLQGTVPASGGGTTNFLRADGTWRAPGGSGGIATDPIWTTKGDTVAATGSAAAVRIPVGANGTNFQANSAKSMGVGWAENAQNSLNPTASFTLYANNSLVLAGTLVIAAGITITQNAGSVLKILGM